ncbi:hypothetical protein GCM10009743_22980 [Kribbella swartbergensis]
MTSRRYRLSPWLIRVIIPPATLGAYVLWDDSAPIYVGRSDTDLRRRLISHAIRGRVGISATTSSLHWRQLSIWSAACITHLSGKRSTSYIPHERDGGPGTVHSARAASSRRDVSVSANHR